jgi:gamma-glutamylcyclotransferase (GGCT)/AIG2-like uncharacterized protein YtfP
MPGRISQQWSDEQFRRSLIAGIRGWNNALSHGAGEQLLAADLLQQHLRPYDSTPASSAPEDPTPAQTVDRLLDFPSRRLAVYGSLAPGRKNHHVMAGAQGTWRPAVLRGSLGNEGWGAGEGFLGFLWDGTDTPIAAHVFSSPDLPQHWQRLDEFEGPEYKRILAPVEIADGEIELQCV